MWAALLGTAFASKATTAGVGLAVLLAGVGTAEVTGIGPQVRESLGITQPAGDDDGGDVDAFVVEDDEGANASENASENGAEVTSSEETVGNLVTNIRPDGTFSLRGILRADGIETSSGDTLPLGEAEVTIPGQPSNDEPNLEDYEGFLVLVTGTCDLEGDELVIEEDCTVESVKLLGQAGQGKPEDAGQPDVLPSNAPEGAGQPENPGKPDVQPNNGQQPVETGKPSATPGGNPNIS